VLPTKWPHLITLREGPIDAPPTSLCAVSHITPDAIQALGATHWRTARCVPTHCVGELKGIGVEWFRLQFSVTESGQPGHPKQSFATGSQGAGSAVAARGSKIARGYIFRSPSPEV